MNRQIRRLILVGVRVRVRVSDVMLVPYLVSDGIVH